MPGDQRVDPRSRKPHPHGRSGIRVTITRWLAGVHPAGLIHGAVVMGATLALMGDHSGTDASLLGAAGVLVVYWLTHAYTDALGRGIDGDPQHLLRRLSRCARHEVPILLGGAPALLTFAVMVASGSDIATAMSVGLWLTVLLMGSFGYLAAHLAGITGWRLVAETAFSALVGCFMVALNTLLH